jgi:general secretion pathway protein L
MQVDVGLLLRWFETLAGIVEDLRQWRQGRRSIVIRKEAEGFVIRRADGAESSPIGKVAMGAHLPADVALSLRGRPIDFELDASHVVARRLTVPSQAKDVLSGIVRNQIERLSPWPVAKTVYGFEASKNQERTQGLDVAILMASRKTIDAICDQLAASNLTPRRILARTSPEEGSPALPLWTRAPIGLASTVLSPVRMIAAALGALVFLSAAATLWGFLAANEIWTERGDVAARAQALRQSKASPAAKASSAARSPGERAWAMKEGGGAAVAVLEALTRALPDDAYLIDLSLEGANLRVTGFSTNAPPLIGALQESGQFSGAHFFSATTKDPQTGLYRFSIEAQVAPQLKFAGD